MSMDPADFSIVPYGDREVIIRRSFAAPRPLVFDAWTKPALLKRWNYGPDGWTLAVCTVDLRVGGSIRLEWRGPDGETMAMTGIYQAVIVPSRIMCSERFDEDWTGGEALSTLLFTDRGQGTLVTNTIRYASTDARAFALSSGMEHGMKAGLDRLAAILARPGSE